MFNEGSFFINVNSPVNMESTRLKLNWSNLYSYNIKSGIINTIHLQEIQHPRGLKVPNISSLIKIKPVSVLISFSKVDGLTVNFHRDEKSKDWLYWLNRKVNYVF